MSKSMTKELEQIKEAFAGLIKICEEVADFKNGVESQGVDEGECVAGIYIVAAKEALIALKELEDVVSEHNSFLKFTYKQVERGMFSDCMGAETALSNIAHQPESPFKNPKWNWDVSHLPYADAFHAKFPRE